jgi:hypothetical protein
VSRRLHGRFGPLVWFMGCKRPRSCQMLTSTAHQLLLQTLQFAIVHSLQPIQQQTDGVPCQLSFVHATGAANMNALHPTRTHLSPA